jgi:hypothetical protein
MHPFRSNRSRLSTEGRECRGWTRPNRRSGASLGLSVSTCSPSRARSDGTFRTCGRTPGPRAVCGASSYMAVGAISPAPRRLAERSGRARASASWRLNPAFSNASPAYALPEPCQSLESRPSLPPFETVDGNHRCRGRAAAALQVESRSSSSASAQRPAPTAEARLGPALTGDVRIRRGCIVAGPTVTGRLRMPLTSCSRASEPGVEVTGGGPCGRWS